jgi:AraC-like DNA-binding protein
VERARSVSDFVRAPTDRYVAGRTWLAFCGPGGIAGFVLWGSSSVDDVAELLSALPVEGSPLADPRARYVDIRRLGGTDPASFESFVEHFARHHERLGRLVRRVAVVRAAGIGAVLAAGFNAAAPMPYPVEFFTEPSAGLAWLGAESATLLASEIDDLWAQLSGTTRLLHDLRAHLRADLREATIARAAAALALSTRSLQRRMSEQQSTFQEELLRVRVQRAEELLLGTSYPLSRIAAEVGFASTRHFGVVFREATGEPPRRWRVRRRTRQT